MKTRYLFAAIPAALLVGNVSAGQFSVDFSHYTGYQDASVNPLDGISLVVNADEAAGTVDFTFSMDALEGVGTVKTVWFESGSGLDRAEGVESNGQVDMRLGRGGENPAASSGILNWEGTNERVGRKGSAANGLDAGEQLTIQFDADSDFFAQGLDAIMSGEVRIAFHLQRLGANANKSAHFVSHGGNEFAQAVPLPTTGAMAGAVLFGGAARRRRR